MTEEVRVALELAAGELWRRGEVAALLCLGDPVQLSWVRLAQESPTPSVWMVARQRGKSFAALALACELCARQPGSIVRYATLTGKSAKAIVLPTLGRPGERGTILELCPADQAPVVKEHEGLVLWANGSVITFAGTDNEQFDRLRGPRAHLVIIDEAGFVADLERVESALLPQLTTTNGGVVYLSTPPESPSHPFLARYASARARGRAVHDTIDGNPRLGVAGVLAVAQREAARLGLTVEQLYRSTYWRREYLAEVVLEETRAAVPAWADEVLVREVIKDVARPEHWDAYVGLDWGFGDPSAAVFGWHDVAHIRLIIEDEIEMRGSTLSEFARAVKAREVLLYGESRFNGTLLGAKDFLERTVPDVWLAKCISDAAPRQPYLRVGDNDLQVLAELASEHGYAVMPSRKDDKAMAVDALNTLLRQRRIIIHPRCVRLQEQLGSTLWNRSRTEWERTARDHGDLLDALVYLTRNIRWHRDCRPKAPKELFRGIQPQDDRSSLARAFAGRR